MGIRAGGYAVSVLLGVASAAIAFRYLGVVDSGRLITVLAIVTIAGGVSDIGLSSLAVREYATMRPGARDDAMRNLLGLRLALAVGGILAATAFAAVAGYPTVMVVGTLIASSALLVGVVQQNLAVSLSATLRLGWVTTLTLLGSPRRGRRVHHPLSGRCRPARVLRSSSARTSPGTRRDVGARPWDGARTAGLDAVSLAADGPRHPPLLRCGPLLHPLLPLRRDLGVASFVGRGDGLLRRFLPGHRRADAGASAHGGVRVPAPCTRGS